MGIKWIPNAITLSRLILTFTYVQEPVFPIGLIIALTDTIDGKLARLLNAQSKIGAFADAAADMVFLWASWIIFYMRGLLALPVLILLLAPRIITIASVVFRRLKYKKWLTEHAPGARLSGFMHYIGVLILLASIPHSQEIINIIIAISLCGALSSAIYSEKT